MSFFQDTNQPARVKLGFTSEVGRGTLPKGSV